MYKSLLDVVADAQSLDELTVLDDVVLLDVGKKTTTTADEHEQATTGVEVLLVGLHVLGQLLDALGQDGDLNLGVTGIDRGVTELGGQLRLALFGNSHCFTFRFASPAGDSIRLGLGSRRWSEHPRSRYQQVGMLPQAARARASSPTQHEFHRTEPLIGVRGGPNMRKPQQKRSRMRIDPLVHKDIERHGHQSAKPCNLTG